MNTSAEVAEFPPLATKYLQAFYTAKEINNGSCRAKIDALREAHGLKDAVITADEGIKNDEEELRVLEFYILTKRGII